MARSSVKHRFFLLFVVCCLPTLLHAQEPTPLVPGQSIEREIAAGQTRCEHLDTLEADEEED